MTDYLDKNGIQVTPDKEKLDNLLFEIQTARKALGWKELTEWTENYGQGSEPWLKDDEK